MDRLDQYRVFMQIAQRGSFIKAARALDLPRASVSAALQQLETSMGVRLLQRTTRQAQLTSDGRQLLERVRPLLADADEVDQLFQTRRHQVSGYLSVNAPSRIAHRLIAPALPGLLRSYPRLQVGLSSTDRAIDLIHEGADCAIRVGVLHDSSLVVRPLGHIAFINCASPGYLHQHGIPVQPQDLLHGHASIGFASPTTGRELPWEYETAEGSREMPLPSRVIVDNAESYLACCRADLGIIQVPRYDVQHLLDSGELIEVMPSFCAAALPISILYPHRRERSRRLVAFAEWFETLIKPFLEPQDPVQSPADG